MSGVGDIATNLVAAFIGAGIVSGTRWARVRFRYRASRRFWRPLLHSPSHLVIAEFLSDDARDFEMAGLTGLGELHSVAELLDGLARADLPTHQKVSTPTQSSPAIVRDNLIVLGGPDVNKVALALLNCGIADVTVERDSSDRNVIVDRLGPTTYRPSHEKQHVSGSDVDVIKDFGIVVRSRNPFDPDRHILLVCGAYGYGVIAGVQICIERSEELFRFMQAHDGAFEAVVSFSMTGSPPGLSKIEMLRPLRHRPQVAVEVPFA